MNRLCIFVTFDFENIVDEYIAYMLGELRKVVSCLIVVCNYKYIAKGSEYIYPYADKVFYRANIGFDAGAYKDALCCYAGWDEVSQYDEILLVNDSFYGPLYSFKGIFDRMEKVATDYWGLTRAPKGMLEDKYAYGSHIQSYFIVFRKSVLQSIQFRKFWADMVYPQFLTQAIIAFELGCNSYLEKLGFLGTAVTDLTLLKHRIEENENPYMRYPLELIRDAKIPIFKRKSLKLENTSFDNALRAFKYIENDSEYDANLIMKHLLRMERKVNPIGLDKFYATHSNIYIYGAGVYGKNLAQYFEYRGWVYKSFLVTNIENESETCISFDKADIADEDGIIIAVGNERAFCEILNLVKKRCDRNQIYNMSGIL